MPEITTVDLIIRMGKLLREARGLPVEKNVGKIYEETAMELGFPPMLLVTGQPLSAHAQITPGYIPGSEPTSPPEINVPKKACPNCGKKESMNLGPLCTSCLDAEGGKYLSMWFCGDMDRFRRPILGTGCGFKERSEKAWVQWLDELGIDFKSGLKKDMGVKTYTDEGLK
jgi:hypothetical protein